MLLILLGLGTTASNGICLYLRCCYGRNAVLYYYYYYRIIIIIIEKKIIIRNERKKEGRILYRER